VREEVLVIGKMLGPYEIVSSIGSGGMGQVYRAKDTRLGRTVAIKVLNKEHMQRFEREARAIAALNHPHICTLHDIGPDYLVMEYVEGSPIKGPMQVEEVVKLAIQIAGALDEAHKRGILHRDLKPGNIMVTSSGSTKLLDFGLAKLSSGTESETASTMDGAVMGTPAYMSPEQAQGMPVDARSDIFSFGAVLYEIISGTRAFEGTSTVQVLSAVLRDEPKPLQTLPQLERIVMRCIFKQPAQRFQTMAEVKTALEQISVKPANQQPSIAVLPFLNMSGDKEQEYFSDGLAEEIINALAQIPGLKVTARTSAFAFKGKQEDIRRIAEALGVANVLEGSVRKAANRIRVTAQLISAADGNHIWSERYDREMTDVFAIQDEISQAITDKLRVRLSGDCPAVKRRTENMEAYNLCLRGRFHLSSGSAESMTKAKEYYEQAIAADPYYAPPWVGLSQYYYLVGMAGIMPSKAAIEKCNEASLKALELDELLPEAHSTIGVLKSMQFDWAGAERKFQRAMELGPTTYDTGMQYAFYFLAPLQRFDEAVIVMQKALELDPLSPIPQQILGLIFMLSRQNDRALEQLRSALDLNPHFGTLHTYLGLTLILAGKIEEGVRSAETGAQFLRIPATLAMVGFAYAKAGRISDAQKILIQLQDLAHKTYVPPYVFIMICMGLGKMDECFAWMEKAVEEQGFMTNIISISPLLDPLRSHPRYHALLRKMNLEA
jgi:TolB-like protein/tetratricopeptide (TPR) repeat protein/predicted Ser/Thr protein kinase